MFDTRESVIKFLDNVFGDDITEYATEYGEPGYSTSGDLGLIVLGNYNGVDLETRFPGIATRLEELGVQFEWYDEWTLDYETGNAYRTQPDCYSWQPSFVYADGEIITPDSGPDAIIEWARDDADRAIPATFGDLSLELEDLGYIRYGEYRAGWGYYGPLNTDPRKIAAELPGGTSFVFVLTGTGQFDAHFDLYVKTDT